MANDVCVKTKDGKLLFPSPSGEKVRIKYIWNENHDGLVEHERIDIVKDMNEKARGMSITEQIIRLDHGDTSVLRSTDIENDGYSCDVSNMPEHPIEIIDKGVQAKAQTAAIKAYEEKQKADAAEIKKLQDELVARKQAYDEAVKALDAKKGAPVEDVKEGE